MARVVDGAFSSFDVTFRKTIKLVNLNMLYCLFYTTNDLAISVVIMGC